MKKMSTTLLAATLACSLAATPALAIARSGAARAAVQAGLQQKTAVTQPTQTPSAASQSSYLQINEPGTYVLTGNMRGTVRVNPGEGNVTLVMDNAFIDGHGGPAIQALSGDSLTIKATDRSNSFLNGGIASNFGGMLQVPAIQTSVPTTFEGSGAIMVNGNRMTPGSQIAPNANLIQVLPSAGSQQMMPGAGMAQPGQQMMPGAGMAQQAGGAGSQQMMPGAGMAQPGQQAGGSGQQAQPGQSAITGTVSSPSAIVASTATNTAGSLVADLENATYYNVGDSSQVKITEAGTYVVTGTCSDGNITVKKGTTGVVLILDNLDLTSTTGATVSVNKNAEVKIVMAGNVTLTDNENPADEESTDAAVADAYDGAALKVKAESQVYITGEEGSTLTINGNAKNGIKAGDDSSLIIDGGTISITAANDGINANYDLTIASGDLTVNAGDDAIHADHILTIGNEESGEGPNINVESSTEGLEATVVNIFGGDIDITSSDDAINAANKDAVYEGELDYSVNMTDGDVTIHSGGDGIDSNGNVNLVGGSATINSASGGGEAGIDYDGDLYVSEEFELNNRSGVAGADGMGGQMGQPGMSGMPGMMNGGPGF